MIILLNGQYSTTHLVNKAEVGERSGDGVRIGRDIMCCGGLRTDGYKKLPYVWRDGECYTAEGIVQAAAIPLRTPASQLLDSGFPLITIVTVVFNGAAVLEDTINSVLQQSYPNVEYIIVDGGSTDGTLEIISRYEHAIDFWISEKDHGIYDAMNKAVGLATGAWINFMNAGDLFAGPDALQNVLGSFGRESLDLVYGNHFVDFLDGSVLPGLSKPDPHGRFMPFSHQAAIYRTKLLLEFPFDVSYRLAADFDQLNRLLSNGIKWKRLDMFVAKVEAGGASDTRRLEVMREYSRIAGFHPVYAMYVVKLLLKAALAVAVPRRVYSLLERRARARRFGS